MLIRPPIQMLYHMILRLFLTEYLNTQIKRKNDRVHSFSDFKCSSIAYINQNLANDYHIISKKYSVFNLCVFWVSFTVFNKYIAELQ